uniref:Putative secreted protein n=1 Tax=Xenopsylla cheopis TaxID=163159 RepID=A0A6M2DVL2_XENCH
MRVVDAILMGFYSFSQCALTNNLHYALLIVMHTYCSLHFCNRFSICLTINQFISPIFIRILSENMSSIDGIDHKSN